MSPNSLLCKSWRRRILAAPQPQTLDLTADLEPIAAFIKAASERYAQKYDGVEVTGVELSYFVLGGLLGVSFFDDPEFHPNRGDMLCLHSDTLRLPHWGAAHDRCFHTRVRVTDRRWNEIETVPAGEDRYPDNWSDVVVAMGDLVAGVIAERHGELFGAVTKAVPYQVGVFDDSCLRLWLHEIGPDGVATERKFAYESERLRYA